MLLGVGFIINFIEEVKLDFQNVKTKPKLMIVDVSYYRF